MSTYAIGDIHGNLDALQDVLRQVRNETGRGDTVVFLGDYIDRGPDSRGCIDAILEFQRESKAEVVCLMGNHEEWFLRTMRDYRRHSWLLGMEAFDTIRSYSGEAEQVIRKAVSDAEALYSGEAPLPYEVFFSRVPAEHIRFFERLKLYHQTVDCVCTHGGVDPAVASVEDQPSHALTWGANGFPEQYSGANVIVYGHWNNAVVNEDGWPMPLIHGQTIGLDTISHGVLTAIQLPDRRMFQSADSTRLRSILRSLRH